MMSTTRRIISESRMPRLKKAGPEDPVPKLRASGTTLASRALSSVDDRSYMICTHARMLIFAENQTKNIWYNFVSFLSSGKIGSILRIVR